jgi:hypothetical protein
MYGCKKTCLYLAVNCDEDAMRVALRVLVALSERHDPDQAEVKRLKAIAATDKRHLPTDELACEVIQQALKHRAEARERRPAKRRRS